MSKCENERQQQETEKQGAYLMYFLSLVGKYFFEIPPSGIGTVFFIFI